MEANRQSPSGVVPPKMPMHLMRRRKVTYALRRLRYLADPNRPADADAGDFPTQSSSSNADAEEVLRLRSALASAREERREAERLAHSLSSAGETAAQEVESLRAQIAAAQTQLDEAKNAVARARADMDMQRRRLQKEKDDLRKFSSEEVLRSLFPPLDNFSFALDPKQGPLDPESLSKGVTMIHRELLSTLQRQGLEPIIATGVPFDPKIHDAVNATADPAQPDGTVLSIMRPGYQLHDKVLRPAMVCVNKLPQHAPLTPLMRTVTPLPLSHGSAESIRPIPTPRPAETPIPKSPTPLDHARQILETKFE
jgi:molecular chaperone GrpE